MEVLPSLARAGIARSFDPTIWPEGTAMDGDDVLIAGVPSAALAGGAPSTYPVVVSRISRLVRSGPVVLCDVVGELPPHASLADVAWPGVRLAGARMRQLLVRGADGTRLAARVEVPVDVPVDAPIALALTLPHGLSTPGARSFWPEACAHRSFGRLA
ncbi:hypothetical protein FK529_15710 [Tsukamurella asaccharolytica]|uniref:Uncharacterized protein n=1 Tax=Tsukamurella asaccharolytica TaxID=2592067 RepID=A0A5C5R5P8_9ACTN|nr:hypothetical protein [Tsukamurella asaccharolytica]TWS18340.1 hypothetical protein FK529_15710 [Tsukamurella asaccharolytica]